MHRKYRIIHGISYPNLFQGENQPKRVVANINDREEFYNDDAIRLANADCKFFEGRDICVDHDESKIAGKITSAWKDRDNHMRMTARIFVDTPEGEEIFEKINSGELAGLSVGYSIPVNDNNECIEKRCREISLCPKGFFDGAEVRIAASSGKQENNSINNNSTGLREKFLIFEIMAEEAAAAKKDGAELVVQYDEMLKKVEEMQQRIAQQDQAKKDADDKLKLFQDAELKRREEYAKQQEPVLNDHLEIIKEQFGGELPVEYVESMKQAFTSPEASTQTAVVIASQKAYKQQKETNEKLQTELSDLATKVKKMEEQQPFLQAHVEATQRRMNMVSEPKEISVDASEKPKMFQLFQPSDQERALYGMRPGAKPLDMNVTASDTSNQPVIPEAPVHPYTSEFPKSMRHLPSGKRLFNFICSRDYDTIPQRITTNNTKRIDD